MALVVAHQTVKNSNDTNATGSITPGAGKVLIAGFIWNGGDADITSIGGTIGGTWTKIIRFLISGGDIAMYWCTDYNASGTFQVNAAATTWTAMSLFTIADSGIRLTNPVRQSKSAHKAAGGLTVSATFDSVPTRATFGFATLDPAVTAGAGYTTINTSATWASIATEYASPGAATVSATAGNTNQSDIIGFELAYTDASRPSFKTGWRR